MASNRWKRSAKVHLNVSTKGPWIGLLETPKTLSYGCKRTFSSLRLHSSLLKWSDVPIQPVRRMKPAERKSWKTEHHMILHGWHRVCSTSVCSSSKTQKIWTNTIAGDLPVASETCCKMCLLVPVWDNWCYETVWVPRAVLTNRAELLFGFGDCGFFSYFQIWRRPDCDSPPHASWSITLLTSTSVFWAGRRQRRSSRRPQRPETLRVKWNAWSVSQEASEQQQAEEETKRRARARLWSTRHI